MIACANVANLMTAQASARAREMALRVSIGAGRGRLVQLVLVESAWLSALATAIGVLFAWWAAPFVVSLINPPNNPARLALPADWRVLGFGVALTLVVTGLFGLMPALRASAVAPVSALRGGSDPHAHRRGMYALIAGQVGFCVLVLFVAGLFVATFERLTHLATGFSAERVVTLETVARPGRQAVFWDAVATHLREIPGVERVSISSQPLMSGWASNSFLSINGAPQGNVMAYFLSVSPGWLETMKIPLIGGRDFLASDTAPGAAIVNETFAKIFFNGENPIGRTFENAYGHVRFRIVGLVRDARYRSMREPMLPVAYKPFLSIGANGDFQTPNHAFFIVRTSSPYPLTLAPVLRHEVTRARPEFRVSTIRTQTSLNEAHTVRERLLAMLALFFAGVALVLAGVGLYGSLHYSVLQRRREIGIRLAIGAPAGDIARGVTLEMFAIVAVGAVAGLVFGVLSARSIESLFYEVKRTDPAILAWPLIAMGIVAVFAAVPPVIRALRIDPVAMLRAD
jgi:predicted permease